MYHTLGNKNCVYQCNTNMMAMSISEVEVT
jgi:hypothetical protein